MKQSLAIAAIQSISVKGDIAGNAGRHLRLAGMAAEHGARFVLFPELSLTGYEPAIAHEVALGCDDPRLNDLRTLAQARGITIVVGAPVTADGGQRHIAALICQPDDAVGVYAKQHLHAGEAEIFAPGDGGAPVDVDGAQFALAVCADIAQASHAEQAARDGAAVYAASVLITDGGYQTDTGLLRQYAESYRMPVVMANHAAATGGWKSAGRSAIWDQFGRLVVAAPDNAECIVIAERTDGHWQGRVIAGSA